MSPQITAIFVLYLRSFLIWQFWVGIVAFAIFSLVAFGILARSRLNERSFAVSMSAITSLQMATLILFVAPPALGIDYSQLWLPWSGLLLLGAVTAGSWIVLFRLPALACLVQTLISAAVFANYTMGSPWPNVGLTVATALVSIVGVIALEIKAMKDDIPRASRLAAQGVVSMVVLLFYGASLRVLTA